MGLQNRPWCRKARCSGVSPQPGSRAATSASGFPRSANGGNISIIEQICRSSFATAAFPRSGRGDDRRLLEKVRQNRFRFDTICRFLLGRRDCDRRKRALKLVSFAPGGVRVRGFYHLRRRRLCDGFGRGDFFFCLGQFDQPNGQEVLPGKCSLVAQGTGCKKNDRSVQKGRDEQR